MNQTASPISNRNTYAAIVSPPQGAGRRLDTHLQIKGLPARHSLASISAPTLVRAFMKPWPVLGYLIGVQLDGVAASILTCKHFRPDAGQGVHEAVAGAGVRVQIDGVASGGHLIGKRLSRFGVGEALHLVQATELHKRARWAIVRVCGFSKLCKCERQVMVRRPEANSKTNIMAGAPPPS